MDKYEEAVRKYHRSGAMLHIIGPPIGLAEVLQELAQFASWYENKYLAEALTAAVEMRMHASYTDAMLEEKREKKTCECEEWKLAIRQIDSAFANHLIHHGEPFSAPAFRLCPYCGRRIVEVRDEKE